MPTPATTRAYVEHFGVVPNVNDLEGDPVLVNKSGSAQCVELVKQLAHAPGTQPNNWAKGLALTPEVVQSLKEGSPIATGWNASNFYPNQSTGQHAGLYAGPVRDQGGRVIGFYIIEQYARVTTIQKRTVYFNPEAYKIKPSYLNNGLDYATIQW